LAAAAARRWAAAGRSAAGKANFGPTPTPALRPTPISAVETKTLRAARVALFLPALLAAAALLCAASGFAFTRLSESRIEAEQHRTLQRAVEEFHDTFGDIDAPDDVQLRTIAHRAGLGDLRFDANPTGEPGRQVQSLHDGRGRIVGWFSWVADHGLVGALDRAWGLLATIGAALAFSALFALRAARRLTRSLDDNAEALAKLASRDALTGLPNHQAMMDDLEEALADRRAGIVIFALVDLDGFREVNDTLGRRGGDAVFKTVTEHLQIGLPPDAVLGRFEEDEFAVVFAGNDLRSVDMLVDALRAALMRPIFLDRMWQITASIGVAHAPADGTTGDDITRRAGLALRAAKRQGRNSVRRFEPQMEIAHAQRRFLLHELQSAIALQEFEVFYQPVVAAEGGALIGVEALLRWTHPTHGAVPPSVFIPLAEQNGLMSQLGEQVLRRALSDGVRWPSLSIAVNLSPVQIRDRWLVDLVAAVMAETGIAASRVVLEITEGVLVDNPEETQARLEALRALGVSIALDDFGTGYSSLSYLQKFPFDRLKIDRAFVASLGSSGNAGAIIQSIVTLGHALGMKVLAEGVESDEQRVLLRLAGCDEMQGFLFARPVPAAEIDRMMASAGLAPATPGAATARPALAVVGPG
jgi:diguanylate cyclase (GGDEF)-like protein